MNWLYVFIYLLTTYNNPIFIHLLLNTLSVYNVQNHGYNEQSIENYIFSNLYSCSKVIRFYNKKKNILSFAKKDKFEREKKKLIKIWTSGNSRYMHLDT